MIKSRNLVLNNVLNMISFESALKIINKEVLTKKVVLKKIECSIGSVLSKPVISQINHPLYNRSIMDGYALISPILKGTYTLCGSVTAGDKPLNVNIEKNCLVSISTGSILPCDADQVVKIEDTEIVSEGKVKVNVDCVQKWKFVRKIGCDVKKGSVIAKEGEVVTTVLVTILAQLGIKMVEVFDNSLRIGIFSTGNEVVDMKEFEVNSSGKICDVNRFLITKELESKGFKNIKDCGIIRDNEEEAVKKITNALKEVDFLITTGAVSMGSKDIIKPALQRIGNVHFKKVAIKPGKPVNFCTCDGVKDGTKQVFFSGARKYIFGLPGNPVSAFFGLRFLVLPALNMLIGKTKRDRIIKVKVIEEIKKVSDRDHFVRANIYWKDDHFVGISSGNQNSSRLMSLKDINGFMKITMGNGNQKLNSFVDAYLIGDIKIFSNDINLKKIIARPVRACGCDHSEDDHFSIQEKKKTTIFVGVLTVSTRASKGIYDDKSGPTIIKFLEEQLGKVEYKVEKYKIVPDSNSEIKKSLNGWCDSTNIQLIFTTGGTGFSQDDNTPEATRDVIDFETPNIINGVNSLILTKVPMAMLSRAVAGVKISENKRTMIINLPGKPKACVENLEILMKARISHAITLMNKKL